MKAGKPYYLCVISQALGNNNLDPVSDLFPTISNKTRNEESGRIEDGHSLTESENVSATDEESDLSTGEKREVIGLFLLIF